MEQDVIKIEHPEVLSDIAVRAEIDAQVATAKMYPRNITKAVDNAIAIVTMDMETAQSCGYALPRAGKKISGASVHLARILASEWGNLRVQTKIKEITPTQVVAEAICFDLEKNYAVKVEARRSIVGKKGRYTDDMITVNGMAISSIAFRNAVFGVIPKSIVNKVYKSAQNKITGDITDEQKLLAKRKQVLDGFRDTYGVTEKEILKALGLNSVRQIKADEIVTLIQMGQTLQDGESTVDEMFERTSPDNQKNAEQVNNLGKEINEKFKLNFDKDDNKNKE